MSEVTRILSAIEQGDPHAAQQLLPLVYDELRRLAAQKMAQEAPGQTLQATALVHDAAGGGSVRGLRPRLAFREAAARAWLKPLVPRPQFPGILALAGC